MLPAVPAGQAAPRRAIGVELSEGRLKATTGWMALPTLTGDGGSPPRQGGEMVAVFDAFGGDAAGIPTGFCTSGCTQNNWCPSSPESMRWWSGTGFRSPMATNDMLVSGIGAGRSAVRSQIAWWWAHAAPMQCFVAILTGDNFSGCPSGSPPVSGNLGGVIIDFGPRDNSGGYWWADVDLRGSGLAWQLPVAEGSYTIMLGTDYDAATGAFVLDPTWGTQPMRWGTGERAGSSGPMQWDDWRNANGTLEWNECSYYDDVVHCPRPQGAMASFWVETACYANCDGSSVMPVLTSNDFLCFVNAYASGESFANCDASTGSPALTPNDFQCFLTRFASGCP